MDRYVLLLLVLGLAGSLQANEWTAIVQPRTEYLVSSHASRSEGRIVGGEQAMLGQFPHQAALILDFLGFCGGSLISDTVVLSAAHCITGTVDFEIHLGLQNINDETEPGRVIVQSRSALYHQDFDPVNLNNDIGLIFLPNPVSGPNIMPIRVPSRSQANMDFTGTDIILSGWGRPLESDPALTEELMYVNTTVISNTQCLAFYPDIIQSCHMCFDTGAGTVGICNGDPGGPVVIEEDDMEMTLIGVSCFISAGGCQDGLPQGSSRLTCHLDWLEANAGVNIRP